SPDLQYTILTYAQDAMLAPKDVTCTLRPEIPFTHLHTNSRFYVEFIDDTIQWQEKLCQNSSKQWNSMKII
ncbi:MAG: hypothetical protein WBF08_04600, partial [Candidatus Bathyarchaeia archaeon]